MPASDVELLQGQYVLHNTIGAGGFAKVKSATHILTGDKVAIKIMDKRCLGDDLPRVKTEVAALKELCHQQICRLYHVIDTPEKILLVLEHCSGGELFDYIVRKDRLAESEARHFFRQILSSIAFVHNKGYAHRDLKPENLLLSEDLQLKLIDFGLCAKPQGGINFPLETCCGSPAYAAPELISGDLYLGSEVDIWSLGILLYALLCGFLPFEDENIGVMYKKIQAGEYEEPKWLSNHSKDILRKMLTTNPKERITVQGLLAHPWVAGDYTQPIKWKSIYDENMIDTDCARAMADHYGLSVQEIERRLLKWEYDYTTATYFLLLRRKRRGLSVALRNSGKRLRETRVLGEIQNTPSHSANPRPRSQMNIMDSPTIHGSLEKGLESIDDEDEGAEMDSAEIRGEMEKALREFADTFCRMGDGGIRGERCAKTDKMEVGERSEEETEEDVEVEMEEHSANSSYQLAMKDKTYESINLAPSPSVTPFKSDKSAKPAIQLNSEPSEPSSSGNPETVIQQTAMVDFTGENDAISDSKQLAVSALKIAKPQIYLNNCCSEKCRDDHPGSLKPPRKRDRGYVNTDGPLDANKENTPRVDGNKPHRPVFGRTPPKPGTVPRRDNFAAAADRPASLNDNASGSHQHKPSGSHATPMTTPMTPFGSQLLRDQSNERTWEEEEADSYGSPGRTPRSKTKQARVGRRPPNSGRKMFNSLERGLDRVLKAMTPRKRPGAISGPRTAKTVVNVSTTSTKSPELVLAELVRIFEEKGLSYDRKGWVIRGKSDRLTLELEVVYVEQVQMIGVRRKRLTGDAFYYKKICEDILKLARL